MHLRSAIIESSAFESPRRISILLPDGYRGSRRRFPVLYLHDGSADWLERGDLLGAVREAAAPPFIVVLPEPVDRTREYKLSRAHRRFMFEEVVPWTDAHLRTQASPDRRAVHGVSLGGLMAVALGLWRPDLFGAAGAQGGAFWYWNRRLVREVAKRATCATRFHLACGRSDGNLEDNRALHLALKAAGIVHAYEEGRGRHAWSTWRRTLPRVLRWYFASPSCDG